MKFALLKRPTTLQFAAVLAFALLSAACGRAPAAEAFTPRYNVILVSIDTLRADHLGAYGHDRPTSPIVDAFAADSVRFANSIAQAPSTLHSHASILSSLLPQHHRASWSAKTRLPEEALTLPEVLRDHGYRTAAFAGGGQMAPIFGLDQGFESYEEPGQEHFAGTVRHGIDWMEQHKQEPFFLFLHSYEVHHPYEPQQRYRDLLDIQYDGDLGFEISKDVLEAIRRGDQECPDEDLQYIIDLYDAEIRSMDDGFGQLLKYLYKNGLYDNTMIVFTSDHGEEFNEHGVIGWHSHTLYDELLRVPLIIKYPGDGFGGTVIDDQVRGIDIAPSVLAFLGIDIPAEFSGADLGPLVSGGKLPELVAVSRIDRKVDRERSSIRTEEWKLAGLSSSRSLFDLVNDPEELWDRSLKDTEITESLSEQLESIIGSREPLDSVEVAPTDKTLEELRKLGYLN